MKKIKIFFTAALFVSAAAAAFASSKLVPEDYLYYPNGTTQPAVPVSVDIHCPNFVGTCIAEIDGVNYQLFKKDPSDGVIKTVRP